MIHLHAVAWWNGHSPFPTKKPRICEDLKVLCRELALTVPQFSEAKLNYWTDVNSIFHSGTLAKAFRTLNYHSMHLTFSPICIRIDLLTILEFERK